MRKKLLLTLMLCLLINIAHAAPDTAAHASREANFQLNTLAAWDKMAIQKTRVGRNPAWLIRFCPAGQSAADPAFALKVVDGRKDDDIKQTCVDFASGAASLLLLQLADAERETPSVKGFALTASEVKKYGRYEYMIFRLESRAERAVIYLAITAAGDFLYSFNYKLPEQPGLPENLEIMLSSLEPYADRP